MSRIGTVVINIYHNKREDDDVRPRRRIKDSYAVNSVIKSLGQISEGFECRTANPIQILAIYKSDEVETNDSEGQDESICHLYEIKTDDRKLLDCELPDRSDRLVQQAGIVTGGGMRRKKGHFFHQCINMKKFSYSRKMSNST